MKVVIAGGTGFLGGSLAARLASDGHEIVILSRQSAPHATPKTRVATWTADGSFGPWEDELNGAVVVNLSGESVAAKRWSARQKERILKSRVHATRSLVSAIERARIAPSVLVSGSAAGYYGPLGDEPATEDHPAGSDFLARVCVEWEAEAMRATAWTRVVCIRTGLVLAADGGALQSMLLPFRLGVGGRIGSGRQYWSWIHMTDWVELVRSTITSTVEGPVNATAPAPVTNEDFVQSLGRALHRPALLPAPAFALRLLLGEMADALLLSGQRVVPAKAQRFGYAFQYPRLDDALGAIFR